MAMFIMLHKDGGKSDMTVVMMVSKGRISDGWQLMVSKDYGMALSRKGMEHLIRSTKTPVRKIE